MIMFGRDKPRGSVRTFDFSNYKMYDTNKSKNSSIRYPSRFIFRGSISRQGKGGIERVGNLLMARSLEDSMGVNRGRKWKERHRI